MRVLITGGNGYIGKAVSQILSKSFDVTVLDKTSTLSPSIDYKYIPLDITDLGSLTILFREIKFDVVIHLAALKSISESIQNPSLYKAVNEIGTSNLFEAWNNSVTKGLFIFASSAAVYGNLELGRPIKEDDACSPVNPYGMTKLSSESYLARVGARSGKHITVMRFFNVAGSYNGEIMETSPSNLIPIIVSNALNKKEITIYGNDFSTSDGTASRDYIHVLDVVDAIKFAIMAPKELSSVGKFQIFNLCSGVSFTVGQIVNAFNESFGLEMEALYSARREGEVGIVTGDNSKIRTSIGWEPKRSLNDIVGSYQKLFLN